MKIVKFSDKNVKERVTSCLYSWAVQYIICHVFTGISCNLELLGKLVIQFGWSASAEDFIYLRANRQENCMVKSKGLERKRSLTISRFSPSIHMELVRRSTRIISQGSRYKNRNSNCPSLKRNLAQLLDIVLPWRDSPTSGLGFLPLLLILMHLELR
jgi:hypothetical protein